MLRYLLLLFLFAVISSGYSQNVSSNTQCSKCKGLDYYTKSKICSNCNGTSKITSKTDCGSCYGSGYKSCSRKESVTERVVEDCFYCDGTGFFYEQCGNCQGGGIIYSTCYDYYGNMRYSSYRCGCCGGSGERRFKDSYCNGSGLLYSTEYITQDCSRCDGSGSISCGGCNGTGSKETKTTCKYCIGGQIEEKIECQHLVKPILVWDFPLAKTYTSIEQIIQLKLCVYSSPSITSIVLSHNGTDLNISDAYKGGDVVKTCSKYIDYKLKLQPGLNSIMFKVSNSFGETTSEIKSIYLDKNKPFDSNSGKYYALIIGIDTYLNGYDQLNYSVSDATELSKVLGGYSFLSTNIKLLKNPKKIDILKSLDSLALILRPEDNLLIFYSGHGKLKDNSVGYWLPKDAVPNNPNTWLSNGDLLAKIQKINAKHVLAIVDACFSGSLVLASKGGGSDNCNILDESPSRTAITSGNLQLVPDKSIFASELIKKLSENKSDCLSAENLYMMIKAQVVPTGQLPQHGFLSNAGKHEGGDFIFKKW